MDVSRFLKGAGDRRPSKTVYLSPDPDRMSAADVAASARTDGSLADSEDVVQQARQDAVDSAWKFVVSTVPAAQWEWLLSQHPATSEQRTQARSVGKSLSFNVETFPVAATAACLREAVNPDGDSLTFPSPSWDSDGNLQVDDMAAELAAMSWQTFPLGDTQLLWGAVLELNGTTGPSGRLQTFVNGSTATRSGRR